jgi:hypothetical protein
MSGCDSCCERMFKEVLLKNLQQSLIIEGHAYAFNLRTGTNADGTARLIFLLGFRYLLRGQR